jgi:DNA-directed RNA polymerase specialized sigma24 family protein
MLDPASNRDLAGLAAGKAHPHGGDAGTPWVEADLVQSIVRLIAVRAEALDVLPAVEESAIAHVHKLLTTPAEAADHSALLQQATRTLTDQLDLLAACRRDVASAVRAALDATVSSKPVVDYTPVTGPEPSQDDLVHALTVGLCPWRDPFDARAPLVTQDALMKEGAAEAGMLAGYAMLHNRGDRQATERLTRYFTRQITDKISRLLPGREHIQDREDISQEVLIKLLKAHLDPRRTLSLRGFINKVTTNTVRDARRRPQRPAIDIDQVELASRTPGLHSLDTFQAVLAAISDGSNPPHQALTFLLREPLGIHPAEIVATYAERPLHELAMEVLQLYGDGVIPPDMLVRTAQPLLDDLRRTVAEAVRAPKSREAIRSALLERVVGATYLQQYATGKLVVNISHWCLAVKRRLRSALIRMGF